MEEETLIGILLESEIRMNSLLHLRKGGKRKSDLITCLGTGEQELDPQIEILQDYCLVRSRSDEYELTTLGKLIVDNMAPLLTVWMN